MATTFDVIFLGTSAIDIDPTEGNTSSENMGLLVGSTFGSAGGPLYDNVQTLSPVGSPGATYDSNNNPDQFSVDGTTYRFDGWGVYNVTITYADGTTATAVAKIAQTTTGQLYLTPDVAGQEANQALFEAKPIQSLTLNSTGSQGTGMTADRLAGNFIEPVDGTAGDDSMVVGYTDANGDMVTDGADIIRAGDGKDTINAGRGNDTIYGGAGNDVIDDWIGNDLVYAGDGDDIVELSVGNDTVYMDGGNDVVNLRDNAGQKTLFGGDGYDTLDFRNWQSTTATNVVIGPDGSRTFSHFDGATTGTFSEFEYISGTAYNDTINASTSNVGIALAGEGGDDVLTSGSGDDVLFGDDGNDALSAGEGFDYVEGGAGDDLVYGGAGDDNLLGEAGNDTLSGEAGADTIDGGDGADLIYGGDGNDSLTGGAGDDSLEGGDGDDTLIAGNNTGAGDSLYEGAGNDYLVDSFWNATLDGGAGSDIFELGYGNATVIGGEDAGNTDADLIDFSTANDAVNIVYTGAESGTYTDSDGDSGQFSQIEGIILTNQADTVDASADTSGVVLIGNAGADLLTGGQGDDYIAGGDDDDVIMGGASRDTLIGDAGADSLIGGDGDDSLLGGDGDDSLLGGDGNDTVIAGDGNDTVLGGTGDDVLVGDDFTATGPNLIANGSFETTTGMEAVSFGFRSTGSTPGWTDANGFAVEIHNDSRGGLVATDGSNWLDLEADSGQNSSVSQVIAGVQDGQVYVLTFDAADIADGNDGTVNDNQIQVIWNGQVVKTIDPSDGSWTSYEFHLVGGSGDGSNTLTFAGTSLPDGIGVSIDNVQMYKTTETTGGADSITGGDGNDTIVAGGGGDTVFGGLGDDLVNLGSGNNSFGTNNAGTGGNDIVHGGDGNDYIIGGGENDQLFGEAGNDTLSGGVGHDSLIGGAGNDTISTGDGADTVVLEGSGGSDVVTDFNLTLIVGKTVDQLDVSALTNATGGPVTWLDVVVTDTNGDGTGDAILTFPNGESVTLQGVTPDQVDGKHEMARMGIPCFAAGTPILTPSGPRAVETLARGDLGRVAQPWPCRTCG